MKKSGLILFSELYALLLVANSAHAYLDPGSGSMLLQLVLGGIAGLAVLIKLYWHRFLALLGIRKQDAVSPHMGVPETNTEPETGDG